MRRTSLALTGALFLASAPVAATPRVVASIVPIHSLVAGVMAGVAEPDLLVPGGASPHTYSLRPSEARSLSQADLVVWVGERMETFLTKPIEALASDADVLELAEAPDIHLLGATRAFGPHDHSHAGGTPGTPEAGRYDPHIWLDVDNAIAIVDAVARALVELDPANGQRYETNAAAVQARLEALGAELEDAMRPLRDQPFVVFHEAYRYVEERYELSAAAAVTLSPERAPSAHRMREIRDQIGETNARCLFTEPQFQSSLIDSIVEDTGLEVAVLDPLGAELTAGPDAYFELLRKLAGSLSSCLAPAG